jgi:hypothetical protein
MSFKEWLESLSDEEYDAHCKRVSDGVVKSYERRGRKRTQVDDPVDGDAVQIDLQEFSDLVEAMREGREHD